MKNPFAPIAPPEYSDNSNRTASRGAAPLSWESLAHYLAAYGCTLIALFAASPVAPQWMLGLALLVLVGLPLSWRTRHRGLKIGPLSLDRFACNSIIVLLSFALLFFYLRAVLPIVSADGLVRYLLASGTGAIDILAVSVLIFAAVRCLFVLNDKDAFRSLILTFSALLLLSTTQRDTRVALCFMAWSLLAALMMTLDHRAETRRVLSGVVPAAVSGQDVRLSLRALVGLVGFSLAGALALSYVLAQTRADSASNTESWLVAALSRLGVPQLDSQFSSEGLSAERSINFGERPSTLSQEPAWRVAAYDVKNRRALHPTYWRLFSLAFYDGNSWRATPPAREGTKENLRADAAVALPPHHVPFGPMPRHFFQLPPSEDAFGARAFHIEQRVESLRANSGFLPMLPTARHLATRARSVQRYADGALEAGVISVQSRALVWSEVSRATLEADDLSPAQLNALQSKTPPLLPADQRADYLSLPKNIAPRVLNLAQKIASQTPANASSMHREYSRALLLTQFVRERATYTLSPPPLAPQREMCDVFLFETRSGYCTHFATALAILCRAARMPSRIVSGYVSPEWTGDEGVLRQSMAHAWTEVWISGIGWMRFDATPADDRGDNAPTLSRQTNLLWKNLLASSARMFIKAMPFLGALLFVLAMAWIVSHRRRALSTQAFALHENDAIRRRVLDAFARFENDFAQTFRARHRAETPLQWLGEDDENTPRVLSQRQRDAAHELAELRDAALYQVQPLNAQTASRAETLAAHFRQR